MKAKYTNKTINILKESNLIGSMIIKSSIEKLLNSDEKFGFIPIDTLNVKKNLFGKNTILCVLKRENADKIKYISIMGNSEILKYNSSQVVINKIIPAIYFDKFKNQKLSSIINNDMFDEDIIDEIEYKDYNKTCVKIKDPILYNKDFNFIGIKYKNKYIPAYEKSLETNEKIQKYKHNNKSDFNSILKETSKLIPDIYEILLPTYDDNKLQINNIINLSKKLKIIQTYDNGIYFKYNNNVHFRNKDVLEHLIKIVSDEIELYNSHIINNDEI